MSDTKQTAIIAGATGLVGSELLNLLLEDDSYSRVTILTRRSLNIKNDKLKEIITDLNSLDSAASQLEADVIFCCLGTTQSKAGSKEAFRAIDHDYPVKLATLSKKNGAKTFVGISALGANVNSSIFYNKVKGETEQDLKRIGFENLHIIRPSLIVGDRSETRFTEEIAGKFLSIVNPLLIGGLKKYQSITGKEIALAMHKIGLLKNKGVTIHVSNKLKDLARTH